MESFFDFTITPFYYIGMAIWKVMLILIGVTAGETPQAFSEGTWNYITQSLYPLFLAIGSTLLNVFFLIGYLRSVKKVLRIKLLKEKDTSREKSKRNHWYHALYDMVSCICTDEFIVPESGTERRK